MRYFVAMQSARRALHLLLVLALLLGGLPDMAGAVVGDSARISMAVMEKCPMEEGKEPHNEDVQTADCDASHGSDSVAYPDSIAYQCADTDCDHACMQHGGAALHLAVNLYTTPASSTVESMYSAEFHSLSTVPPFRPPIV